MYKRQRIQFEKAEKAAGEAARRLTSGDCNLTVLYADLGYTNPTSFRRAFKKYYGMTPSEMRDQPRRQEEKSE